MIWTKFFVVQNFSIYAMGWFAVCVMIKFTLLGIICFLSIFARKTFQCNQNWKVLTKPSVNFLQLQQKNGTNVKCAQVLLKNPYKFAINSSISTKSLNYSVLTWNHKTTITVNIKPTFSWARQSINSQSSIRCLLRKREIADFVSLTSTTFCTFLFLLIEFLEE